MRDMRKMGEDLRVEEEEAREAIERTAAKRPEPTQTCNECGHGWEYCTCPDFQEEYNKAIDHT